MRLATALFACLVATQQLAPSSGGPDVAGRWVGELRLAFPDGRIQTQPAYLTLRQFGGHLEGTFGYNPYIQTRLRRAACDGFELSLSSGGLDLDLRLEDGRLSGTATFPGAGAPRTTAVFERTERGNGGASGPERPSVTGTVRSIEAFPMPELGRTRRILVYLPPGYDGGTTRYPAIYMTDGQNLFDVTTSDRGEWQVDETLERLHAEGRFAGAIVVGVEHGGPQRSREYMPAALGIVPDAEGERFAAFVARTLKPYVDRHYRTLPAREHTAVIGASAGAQMAFLIGTEFPELFSKVGALGFVMGRGAQERIDRWRLSHTRHDGMKFYLHVGTEEYLGDPADNPRFVNNLRAQYDALRALGYGDADVCLDVEQGAHHMEAFWAGRFERVVTWLFGVPASQRPAARTHTIEVPPSRLLFTHTHWPSADTTGLPVTAPTRGGNSTLRPAPQLP